MSLINQPVGGWKTHAIIVSAAIGISALFSNATKHDFTGVLDGPYTSMLGRSAIGKNYRVGIHDEDGNRTVLRNEVDIYAGKFYGEPSRMQKDLATAVGMTCTFEVNGWDFLFFRQNILRVKECQNTGLEPSSIS